MNTPIDDSVISSIVTQTIDELAPRNVFTFESPGKIVIGEGAILKLGALLKAHAVKRVLMVADEIVYQRGLLDGAQRSLARAGIETTVFPGITREPSTSVVESGLAMLTQSKADYVLGFGGGSALDAAKVIALLGGSNASLDELSKAGFTRRRTVGLGSVPTTAGTGSEVTNISVIMHADRLRKYVIQQADLMPDLAVIDPELMLDLPASVTAATGIDSLTHAIEAYVAIGANPLSRAMATLAIRSIPQALPVAVGNGRDMSARLDMAVAANSAGLAFNNAGLGLVHAISHQVGARYDIAHGVVNGIFLPLVMEFNALVCHREYATIAHLMGVTNAGMSKRQQSDASAAAVRQLLADIGMPDSLGAFGARDEDFADLADEALQDICIRTNPRSVVKADIIQLLQRASRT